MNREAVTKKIIMKPVYCGDKIDWHITIAYLDGHKEEMIANSQIVGGAIEMLDASARYAMNPKAFK